MKVVERISMGDRGRGTLLRFEGVGNWYVSYYVRGVEHRETTGTPDLKKARRFHRQKMDEVSADRQGLRKFIGPVAQRVQVDELLDDLEKDYKLRGIRSAHNVKSHAKPIRQYFGAMRAVDVTAEQIDRFVEDRVTAGKAPATINRATQILGQAFRLARKRHKVVAIPDIRHLPERNARQGFFERTDFRQGDGRAPRAPAGRRALRLRDGLAPGRDPGAPVERRGPGGWGHPAAPRGVEERPRPDRRVLTQRSGPCSGAATRPGSSSGREGSRWSQTSCSTGTARRSMSSRSLGPRPASRPGSTSG